MPPVDLVLLILPLCSIIESLFLCRFYYLRGFINSLCPRRLDALTDFQTLYKTDTAIFPTQLVSWLVESLHEDERQQANRRPELKRLLLKVSENIHQRVSWVV